MKKRKILLLMLLILLVGCHKKRGANPTPTPEEIGIKKVEDLCETGTIDDLFVKNCTTNQKRSFIERNYGVLDCDDKNRLDCDKIYEYIIDYDDLDLYKMLVKNGELDSYNYLFGKMNLFNERCYDKRSVKVGSYFFRRYLRQIIYRIKINKKTLDIYNYYLDLGVDVNEDNIQNKGFFENSLVHHFLTKSNIESVELEKDYQKLIRRIIRSSEYFFPVLNDENKLSLDKARDLVERMCSARRTIPVVELLNTIGPVVSEDVLINPQRYSGCLLKTETLEALLSPFNKESIKETGLGSRFLKELVYSNSLYLGDSDFYIEAIDDSKTGVKRYQKNKAMDILFNYFSIDDFFRKDKIRSTGLIILPPFGYANLRILKILLMRMSNDADALESLRKSAKELYDSIPPHATEYDYKLRYNAILKFIESQEEGLNFIYLNERYDEFFRW